MIIDKLSDKTYTEHELRYMAQAEIASKISPESEANIARKLDGMNSGLYTPTPEELADIGRYKDVLETVQIETAQAVIDNQLLIDTINYEQALQRLAQYELSVGRPEQTIYKTDWLNNRQIDYVIPAIDPLESTITKASYEDNGNYLGMVAVKNPLIERDEIERQSAQFVIDHASADVFELADLRQS
jgi:hypothetical protein